MLVTEKQWCMLPESTTCTACSSRYTETAACARLRRVGEAEHVLQRDLAAQQHGLAEHDVRELPRALQREGQAAPDGAARVARLGAAPPQPDDQLRRGACARE
jgi:hypothetical protein